jgi:tetratricopeptide (TPR) repeat protein
VALDEGHAETWNALGLALYHKGDARRAEAAFRDGLSRHADHRSLYLGLAALLINSGRHGEALQIYDRVVSRWERFAPAHVGRGILLHELGRPDEAERAFERAVEVSRDRARYETRLAEYRALRASER